MIESSGNRELKMAGNPRRMMEVMPGIWEKNVIRLNDREFCEIVGYIRDNYVVKSGRKARC